MNYRKHSSFYTLALIALAISLSQGQIQVGYEVGFANHTLQLFADTYYEFLISGGQDLPTQFFKYPLYDTVITDITQQLDDMGCFYFPDDEPGRRIAFCSYLGGNEDSLHVVQVDLTQDPIKTLQNVSFSLNSNDYDAGYIACLGYGKLIVGISDILKSRQNYLILALDTLEVQQNVTIEVADEDNDMIEFITKSGMVFTQMNIQTLNDMPFSYYFLSFDDYSVKNIYNSSEIMQHQLSGQTILQDKVLVFWSDEHTAAIGLDGSNFFIEDAEKGRKLYAYNSTHFFYQYNTEVALMTVDFEKKQFNKVQTVDLPIPIQTSPSDWQFFDYSELEVRIIYRKSVMFSIYTDGPLRIDKVFVCFDYDFDYSKMLGVELKNKTYLTITPVGYAFFDDIYGYQRFVYLGNVSTVLSYLEYTYALYQIDASSNINLLVADLENSTITSYDLNTGSIPFRDLVYASPDGKYVLFNDAEANLYVVNNGGDVQKLFSPQIAPKVFEYHGEINIQAFQALFFLKVPYVNGGGLITKFTYDFVTNKLVTTKVLSLYGDVRKADNAGHYMVTNVILQKTKVGLYNMNSDVYDASWVVSNVNISTIIPLGVEGRFIYADIKGDVVYMDAAKNRIDNLTTLQSRDQLSTFSLTRDDIYVIYRVSPGYIEEFTYTSPDGPGEEEPVLIQGFLG